MNVRELLALSIEHNASDLHLSSGLAPLLRVDGELKRLDHPQLTALELNQLLYDIMNEDQCKSFAKKWEIDFSLAIAELARFRVNVFHQERGPAAVFRVIPATVLSLQQLNLPTVISTLVNKSSGLILVTGPTGSGKTTTLAAIIDHINEHRYDHILTIEDPIEFVHHSKKSLINQREVGRDTVGFNEALRSALREDPDIILVGELRDLETMRLAMTAAETGHLVLATLHTHSATQAVNRIIDVFPAAEKAMVRTMLSESLNAVIAQSLLKKEGGGRVAAFEIMVCNTALKHMIREDKTAQMVSVLQTGREEGMFTLDQYLTELVQNQVIAVETAYSYAMDKSKFV
ncbi:MAG: type pilus twitching motility protein PilT [Gammaproteobacteria bacterium]|jgi:twitching motility protein PilT|nr:type pilus twitching motility protein PilT [Gammaproteobacteria bacterium]